VIGSKEEKLEKLSQVANVARTVCALVCDKEEKMPWVTYSIDLAAQALHSSIN